MAAVKAAVLSDSDLLLFREVILTKWPAARTASWKFLMSHPATESLTGQCIVYTYTTVHCTFRAFRCDFIVERDRLLVSSTCFDSCTLFNRNKNVMAFRFMRMNLKTYWR